ncbi:taste receptor type 2 member 10-like [Sceloporus undulatus]|uniref:taste receptor type 2 member 10-like n=1 Tax=Sceloporus undulatus TaxID=8520 RepID=UPI001C4B86C9|nr:taste receptor type 2 member 10-like [Sceloporus undulatus]
MFTNSASPLDILLWAFTGIVSIVCLLGNGFITAVQGQQWLQNKKILTCEFLLISLSTSRFVMQLLYSVNALLYFISPETHVESSRQAAINIISLFFNMASLWSATWLSVFYCVKITNFANRVLLWLKPRINMLAPRLLGMSIVISSISFLLPLVEYFGHKKCGNLSETLPGSDIHSGFYHKIFFIFLPLMFAYTCINCTISIAASILLVNSLWKHIKNLKKSGAGVTDLSTQVHIKVIIFLLFYVFLFFLYFSIIITFAVNGITFRNTEILALKTMTTTFPSAHSIILILTNPKLKEMAACILNIRQRTS